VVDEFPDEQPFAITSTEKDPEVETVMDCVVAPFDQRLPVADDEVNTTEPPEQNVVDPLAVIVGTAGKAVTVTLVAAEVAEQKPLLTVTEYDPEAETVMDCVVSPVDQRLSVAEDEVKTTLPPAQNVVGPPAEIVGVVGVGFTVTDVVAEFPDEQPLVMTSTEKDPEVETVMDCVVAPFDQRLPVADDEVNTTEPPEQNVVDPLAMIAGTAGKVFTVTLVAAEVAEHKPLLTVTEYDPEAETVIACVVSPVDQRLSVAEDEVKTTLPPAQNVVGPPAEIVGVEGVGFTVTISLLEFPDEQPLVITSTVNDPEVETVMDCVVAPFDQRLPVADDEVNITEPPEQNVVDPLAVIAGKAGKAVTATLVAAEVAEHKPLLTVIEYDPEAETVMDCVVSPVDQRLSVAEDEVKTTLPPAQNVVGPPAEIVGVEGVGFTVTDVVDEFPDEQPLVITSTLKDPEVETVMDCVVAPFDQRLPVADDEVNTTEPPEQNVVDPLAVIAGTAGKVFTVTLVAAEVAEQKPLLAVTEYDPEAETVMD
jgi:uncharacterized protein with GYD domain